MTEDIYTKPPMIEEHICESDGVCYTSSPPQWKCKICGKFYRDIFEV